MKPEGSSPPYLPVLSHTNASYTISSYFLNISFHIALSSTPKSSMWFCPSGFNIKYVTYQSLIDFIKY